jgi:hypothetical protein
MELWPAVLVGGVYSEEDKEVTTEGGGGRNTGGGDSGGAPEETKSAGVLEEMMLLVASLYFCFNISVLTAFSSACKDWICCCKAEIAPMHPYTGSLSLKFAS